MPNTIIVGAQWGDEGKGKIVDFLTESADVVARAQGGNNAGHTVINGDKKYVLHLIPSGILWPEKKNVIGNGVVLDPIGIVGELDKLASQDITVTPDNLLISDRAHLTMPFHRALDSLRESGLGKNKIGTTGRGIGPTYADKVNRTGFRMTDLRDPAAFATNLRGKIELANQTLDAAGAETLDPDTVVQQVTAAADRLRPFIADTVSFLQSQLKAGKTILFEGAQGTYLDIDHGTYPYVTSSNTTAGGACTGSGISPRHIDHIVGVAKAYTTRVGEGPFVTENDEFGDRLHGMGREFGATTGRARRCGWLDLVLLRFATWVNGFDQFAVTNVDGLDELATVQLCVAYELDGQRLEVPPPTTEELARCTPVYEELPGWQSDTTGCTSIGDLPANARAYLDRISTILEVPITLVGVGPDRAQTLRA
ncbi:MAG: adenylosuccinate synthase [Verrucomicrobiales bacterium]|nr:adenylosuccinate synthase [Verrucomicrobiales bacterium]